MDLELNKSIDISTTVDPYIETNEVTITDSSINDIEVTFDSNEFSIVGDDMVVVTKYTDAPQWLKDLIDNVVSLKTAVAVGDLNTVKEALDVMLGELEIAKNTYQLSIVSSEDIDSRINTAITSLNSALQQADATILNIAQTATTPAEASAIAANAISASLSANGAIGSTLSNIQEAMTTLENTTASDISFLESTMEGEIVGNANAMQTIRTYVGIDETGASTGTGLSAYLEGSNGVIGGADSQLVNDIKVNAEVVESKFAYNSTLMLNGKYYKSGFGLESSVHTSGTGSLVDPYTSEFWIDASKFKFTNSAKTGSKAPFTIDATGPQPEITFNGKVTFGSGQTGTIDEAIAAVVETVSVGDKNINITDNLIPITSLVADTDNSGYQFVGSPTKSNTAGIDTYAEAQIALDGSDEVYSPYVDDMTISYYYRFGIRNVNDLSTFKIISIDSNNVVVNNDIITTLDNGYTITANNWYIIEGIINPTGGDSSAVGSIRNSNGVKIGSVNSMVIPGSTTKLVLGWLANCTISRIKLCKITADTITTDFTTVNTQLSTLQTNINNISWSSLQGKDLMAQQLGYVNYSALANAVTNGTTVINGGYLNTGLINTGAINANMINTTGLIADDISSSIISGKTINGGIINGARINGAVIKASYLDLNGELEVLTNFVIPVATYNANPSLYSDSVLIAADNTYRIPTSSVIYEQAIPSSMPNNGDILYGVIRSYNCANAGHNVKAVKVRPTISVSSPVTVMDMRQAASYNCNGSFYLGDILLINLAIVSLSSTLVYSVTTADSGTTNYTIYDSDPNGGTFNFSDVRTVVSSGISFTISVGAANSQYGYSASAIIKINQGNHTLTRDFNYTGNGFKLMRLYNNSRGADSCTTALGTNIYINNLL